MTPELKSRIRSTVQQARALLMQETREQLISRYGLQTNGTFEPLENLPGIQEDKERYQTRRQLQSWMAEETQGGLNAPEAVEKLIKETAFTWLNRLVAFKMMEARKIIRGTIDKGTDSNGFKFYLADHDEELRRYESGQAEEAYRRFLLWQCRQIAEQDHLEVLFDPDNLPSRLFPRPRALNRLLDLLNNETLAEAWQQEETIGWVYQYFIEEDKDAVFEKIYRHKQKMDLRDIPKATQIFTPRWIVQYLVENTLGRLWLRMHPDSRLREKMKYYVPNPYTDNQPLPAKPVREITLLDPACGTMHFGLVAFDLFYEMYLEEWERAGQPGWPEEKDQRLKMKDESQIPVAIVENNLYGIDIDLRAIQLSALTLYLKVKSRNKNARIRKLNLTYTDIPPIPEDEIDTFVDGLPLSHPIARELLKQILPELNKAYYLGSLLKIEETVQQFITQKRRELQRQPIATIADYGEEALADSESFWDAIKHDILQGLQAAVERQTNGHSLVAGEAIQGLGLIDALMKKHDVVVCNPPYSGRRNWSNELRDDLKILYPKKDGDLYTAFIDRVYSLTSANGFGGLVTIHSFMFTSSHEEIRKLLIDETEICGMVHLGTRTEFDVANKTAQGFTVYTFRKILRKEEGDWRAVYFRLVKENEEEKRLAFEKAFSDWQAHGEQASDRHIFVVRQEDFKAIPGWPLVYWVSNSIKSIFRQQTSIGEIECVKEGINTGDNFRFVRYSWEIGKKLNSKFKRFIKESEGIKYYENIPCIIKFNNDEIKFLPGSRILNKKFFYREAATFLSLTTGGPAFKYSPPNCIFCSTGGRSIFPKLLEPQFYIGLLNSKFANHLLKFINPTVSYTIGDVARLPYPDVSRYPELVQAIEQKAQTCIHLKRSLVQQEPTSWEYVAPPDWRSGFQEKLWKEYRLTVLESEISEMVYRLYEVGEEDIRQIEAEFHSLPSRGKKIILTADERGSTQIEKNNNLIRENPRQSAAEELKQAIQTIKKYYLEKHIPEEALKSEEEVAADTEEDSNGGKSRRQQSRRQARYLTFEEVCIASGYHPDTVYQIIAEAGWERPEERWEVAYNWLEYAIGILMGRFQPGKKGELGGGIIHKNDFITGSLTISDEEFEEITRFFPTAYRDAQGKHRLPPEVEEQLRTMADPDGIMVLDEGHPDDLPTRIEEVLTIMLGEDQTQQVLATLIGEPHSDKDKFRRFMERDFFNKHHLKMYRKRPIYWLLQTANKNYGFYIFHERIDKDTLYKLQRNYIDPKLNWIEQQMKDLGRRMGESEGAEYRRLAREREKLEELYGEIKTFAEKVDKVLSLTDENGQIVGYDPDINDGVILNMAPLHELIPWNEPTKYWKELQEGRYDWAHMAMRYWPNRVLAKCKKDKSLAIAHGVEEEQKAKVDRH
ncbi:MAG: BREX-1 system adenine-specific DNA-methyltransferase PglX [Methanobacteriota archaeon]|nr:MAG: BREX-1 system adenine-specific DNA-methyltransferase PglX [Euryarchaeota archaeon]